MFERAFAGIAAAVSAAYGGPYHPAVARWPGEPGTDPEGSIFAPGSPVEISCSAQGEAATDAMRREDGFREEDITLLVIGTATLNTQAIVTVQSGPHAGRWALQTCQRDPVGVGWVCRAREWG